MSKSNFIFPWTGRKKKFENENTFKQLNFDGITTVVEPFGGSMSFSQFLYIEKGMTKLKYVYNDFDTNIYNFMKFIKENGMTGLIQLCEHSNKQIPKRNRTIHTKTVNLIDFFTIKARGGDSAYLKTKNKDPLKYEKHVDFIQHIDEITNLNYADIFTMYEDRPDVLIYLDPPYFKNFNSDYQSQNNEISDMTTILVDIIGLFKYAQCHIVYIYCKNALMSYLFADISQPFEYSKIYQTTKKHCMHCIHVK
jgi:site-specific DNA-adenine methylase